MATALESRDGRDVVRCDTCKLVQFKTSSGLCRKCHRPYQVASATSQITAERRPERRTVVIALPIGPIARAIREARGLSQRDLAERMRVPRTYISKLECERVEPTLDTIARVAIELNVPAKDLIALAEVAGRVNA